VSCGGTSVEHQGSGGSTSVAALHACDNPMPVGDSGWIQCDNGALHRESTGMCPTPTADAPAAALCGDCSYLHNGWCFSVGGLNYSCVAGCKTDAECQTGEVCFCDTQGGRCMPASCTTDADCNDGALCATYEGPPKPACGYYLAGVACQSPADKCAGSECNCVLSNDHRECVMGLGGCGRPFLVDGVARRAHCEGRSDWLATDVEPTRLAELGAEDRSELAAHFSDMALMEHASVAAFARFVLELVALGAPSDLVLDASHAMADETRHAELAFALASSYAETTLGPSALALDGALGQPTLESVLHNVLLEGCIGETVAAAEAQELARGADDPVLRGVYALIARDESRHAALAYRFVGWALTRDRELVERTVRAVLGAALAEHGAHAEQVTITAEDRRQATLGIATPAQRTALRSEVLEDVVRPCLNALLASRPTSTLAA
jgi:hypothetical protein